MVFADAGSTTAVLVHIPNNRTHANVFLRIKLLCAELSARSKADVSRRNGPLF
jgi:hypothetical protein